MLTAETTIHEAAFAGDIRQLQILLDIGNESMNQKDEVGQTPLHKASMNGWAECVVFLLERGATVGTQDITGCTALHLAAGNGYQDIAKYLIEKGHANMALKSNKGQTPRYMARVRGQMHMVSFFSDMENKVGSTWLS